METLVIKKDNASLYLNQITGRFSYAILFSGDRYTCVDEYIVLEDRGNLIGICSIAPWGEDYSGNPEIVGCWVADRFRKKGYGYRLLEAGLLRCKTRYPDKKIRVDILSKYILKIIHKLPDELKENLDIRDFSDFPTYLD